MPTEELLKYLDHPEQLNEESQAVIEQWVEEYPFFQTAHLLHIKNIQNLQGSVEKPRLNHTAAYVSDRKVLYYLLHTLPETTAEPQAVEESEPEPDPVQEPATEPEIYDGLQPHEKDIKESLEENIHDTIHKQRDLYDLEPETQIELIPGLAIDIRKAYADENIEFEEHHFSLLPENKEELFELMNEDAALFSDEEPTENTAESSVEERVLEIDEEELPADSFADETQPATEPAKQNLVDGYEKQEDKTPVSPETNSESTFANEKELLDARNRSFTDWLDSIDQENFKPAEEEFIPETGQIKQDATEAEQSTKPEDIKFEIPYDLNKLSLQDDPEPREPEKGNSLRNSTYNSLIDQFIQSNPKIIPKKDAGSTKDISEDSVKEHESFFTDTLAQIYIKQGNYAKAILAYEKLSLKYPEKSTYFAGQISEIKKLISKS